MPVALHQSTAGGGASRAAVAVADDGRGRCGGSCGGGGSGGDGGGGRGGKGTDRGEGAGGWRRERCVDKRP